MRLIRIVHTTSGFRKSFKKLPKKLQGSAVKKDLVFRKNAFDPRLKTHPLKGDLEGYHAYSLNDKYRILLRFISSDEVIYYDIGTHEIYR
ncbi:type II toxin-antitoxin system YafQ family toxin [Elusimicrobiota bacterium]